MGKGPAAASNQSDMREGPEPASFQAGGGAWQEVNLEQETGSDPRHPIWAGAFILITGKAVKDYTGSDVTLSIKRPRRLN